MKLPEYDNRPLPGEPLYRNVQHDEDDSKFNLYVLALVIAFPLYLILPWSLTDLVASIFRSLLQ